MMRLSKAKAFGTWGELAACKTLETPDPSNPSLQEVRNALEKTLTDTQAPECQPAQRQRCKGEAGH